MLKHPSTTYCISLFNNLFLLNSNSQKTAFHRFVRFKVAVYKIWFCTLCWITRLVAAHEHSSRGDFTLVNVLAKYRQCNVSNLNLTQSPFYTPTVIRLIHSSCHCVTIKRKIPEWINQVFYLPSVFAIEFNTSKRHIRRSKSPSHLIARKNGLVSRKFFIRQMSVMS